MSAATAQLWRAASVQLDMEQSDSEAPEEASVAAKSEGPPDE
jgi:hypothetical protein